MLPVKGNQNIGLSLVSPRKNMAVLAGHNVSQIASSSVEAGSTISICVVPNS